MIYGIIFEKLKVFQNDFTESPFQMHLISETLIDTFLSLVKN